MNLDLAEIWEKTPKFGKFLWFILAFMSIWSLSTSIGKWWSLRKAQQETIKFAPEFSQFLEEDNLSEAINLAERYKKSHVARVLGGALAEVKPLIMDGSVTVSDINTAERAVEREMLMEIVQLKRGLAILARSQPLRSSDCSAPCSASSTPSPRWPSPVRAVSPRSRQVSLRR